MAMNGYRIPRISVKSLPLPPMGFAALDESPMDRSRPKSNVFSATCPSGYSLWLSISRSVRYLI